ncbi:MAG: hypothetical protein GXY44_12720 [Phycisphaerales bacterium]|nr:hypothetical protein [Phycisphaerales bacterium]
MNFYIPTAAASNSLSLATFGRSGEIMGFFYPRIDFAQNIREGMPAIRLIKPLQGEAFLWNFAECWQCTQSFQSASNVLITRLEHKIFSLSIEICDVLPPGEQALLRRIVVSKGPEVGPLQFMHYYRIAAGDAAERNAVQVYPEHNAVVQHFRNVVLAVGATEPFRAQCSTWQPDQESPTKQAMRSGELGWSNQSIGRVDFAVAFEPTNQARWQTVLVLAGAPTIHNALTYVRQLTTTKFNDAVSQANNRVLEELSGAGSCPVPELTEAYHRAVISLHDLYDEREGAFLAAPEFDPGYELSGGYGYCWPRDAAVCALAMARIGSTEVARRFFEWAARTQLPSGHWYQRYWVDGTPAASWCVLKQEIQLDQTCAMVHSAGRLARLLRKQGQSFVDFFRPTAAKATQALLEYVDANYLHRSATDLWENCQGTFAYTQAGLIAALKEAHEVFGLEPERTGKQLREAMRDQLIRTFWNPDRKRWLRRLTPEGQPDTTLDSSVMGLIDPWEVLDLRRPEDRALATDTLESVSRNLRSEVNNGKAILRFEGESYMGGGPGCVNTLWLALCHLRMANTTNDTTDRDKHRERAMEEVRIVLANTSPTGQLPELIPKILFSYWAAPHAWASALMIEVALALSTTDHCPAGTFQDGRARVRRRAPSR